MSSPRDPRIVSPEECARIYRRLHWGEFGDRPPSLEPIADPADRNFVVLGELIEVVYRTVKGGDKTATDYQHEFGKRGKGRPWLVFSARTERLAVAGGNYRVTTRGIVG